jgi:6-pyruvoyltetrahydropterin/6-carboxytetrahydropterin synthase
MYTVAVKRDFVAQHFLIGGDWGSENEWHSHHYVLELQLSGPTLDQHGYLVDIVDIEANLEALVAYYKDKTLNDLPEFAGLNPSIEHFARILATQLDDRIQASTLSHLTVKVWENEIAWASFRLSVNGKR